MKKLIIFTFALMALKPASALIFDQIPEKTVTVRYSISIAANVSTNSVVIDLSNTTTWPHKNTGQINISSYRIYFDKIAASTATAKLGVVTYISASTGSVTWFTGKNQLFNVSNTEIDQPVNYAPNFLKAKVISGGNAPQASNGTTPFIYSNDTTLASTTFQNDVVLPSIEGNTAPGLGDIVLSASAGSAAIVVYVEIQYHSEK